MDNVLMCMWPIHVYKNIHSHIIYTYSTYLSTYIIAIYTDAWHKADHGEAAMQPSITIVV